MNISESINQFIWAIRNPVKKSSHRKQYEEIALQFNVNPIIVYRLAHGRRPQSMTEKQIIYALVDCGILHVRSTSVE